MKTLKDLDFKKHPNYGVGGLKTSARLSFDNGYGVSVITGGYGNKSQPYELAVLYKDSICYSTDITDDVMGYLTANDVTNVMRKVQTL